ncbi:MAG TPA: class I SAM-dependent methyltransferase [bacterium]|nr:class I SAM-dependent methyltransferase [bacterium]
MTTKTIYEDGTYFDNNPTWHEEDSPWKAKKIVKIMKKNNVNPTTICEVGCGAGEILNCLLHELGEKVVFCGYEISPQAFEICRKKTKHNLHFQLKDLLEEELMFDVLMAIDVFEHVEDLFGFLRKLRGKGIYKIFHIPLDLSVRTVISGSHLLNARRTVGHIHYFTKETAIATLKDAGYEIVDHFYTSSSLELPNRRWKSNRLNPLRKWGFLIHQDMAVRILGGFSLLVLAK